MSIRMVSFVRPSMSLLPRREFYTILTAVTIIVSLSWYYLVTMAIDMDTMMSMPNMPPPIWNPQYFLLMFIMWSVMMIAMMLPTAVPTILIYASIFRKARAEGSSVPPTAIFSSGYLIMWILFSLAATLLQWALDEAALLSSMMKINNSLLAGCFLILAGIYQSSPIKDVCLQHCRSPVRFISENWRKGFSGSLIMGLHHGFYCIGCCWLLMSLLFFGGVMSLLWIAGLSLFVLTEKTLPLGLAGARITSGILILSGFGVLLTV